MDIFENEMIYGLRREKLGFAFGGAVDRMDCFQYFTPFLLDMIDHILPRKSHSYL
jgi:hypothetical protein